MTPQPTDEPTKPKSRRGFACIDKERQRKIASLGGIAAHQHGTAYEFTPEEARLAGQKGGKTVSQDRAHMATIGSRGGLARGRAHRIARGQAVQP